MLLLILISRDSLSKLGLIDMAVNLSGVSLSTLEVKVVYSCVPECIVYYYSDNMQNKTFLGKSFFTVCYNLA